MNPVRRFEIRLRYAPELHIVYVHNPKAACSSIIEAIWQASDKKIGVKTYRGHPHVKRPAAFRNSLAEIVQAGAEEFFDSTFFSVVRNPYSRIVSAYLDKTVNSFKKPAWRSFHRGLNLSHDHVPTFQEVVEAIAGADPEALDNHYSPQHLNLVVPRIPFDFVGQFEKLGEVHAFMTARGIPLGVFNPHSTKAKDRIAELVSPKLRELISAYFEKDFALFGYSFDPATLDPVRPAKVDGASRSGLERHFHDLRAYRAKKDKARARRRTGGREVTETEQIDAIIEALQAFKSARLERGAIGPRLMPTIISLRGKGELCNAVAAALNRTVQAGAEGA